MATPMRGREAGRQAFLAAAATAIAQRGYHGMSMRELARATGRSVGVFYNYFTSKISSYTREMETASNILFETFDEMKKIGSN